MSEPGDDNVDTIRAKTTLVIGSETDVGQERSANEDSVGYFKTADGRWTLLMVCDGLGGHAGGRTASTLAVETISDLFRASIGDSEPAHVLREAIEETNRVIHSRSKEDPSLRRMGTTAAVLATDGEVVHIAHVGDSRIYRIRGDTMEQLTRDHSTVQRLVDEGLMTSEEARDHPNANFLARCLGPEPEVEVEVQGPIPLDPGDRYLLCSDGLYNMIEEPIIAALITMYPAPEAATKLVALANDRGGYDNISVQILHRADGTPPTGSFDAERFRIVTPASARGAGKRHPDAPVTLPDKAGGLQRRPDRRPGSSFDSWWSRGTSHVSRFLRTAWTLQPAYRVAAGLLLLGLLVILVRRPPQTEEKSIPTGSDAVSTSTTAPAPAQETGGGGCGRGDGEDRDAVDSPKVPGHEGAESSTPHTSPGGTETKGDRPSPSPETRKGGGGPRPAKVTAPRGGEDADPENEKNEEAKPTHSHQEKAGQ